jgi:ParB family chromosome partitioning protein
MALIENIQREDLNPIEEAEAYRHLMSSFDLSQDEVAKRVGKDRSTVANALRLLRLPHTVQQDVMSGQLSMGHARALLPLESGVRLQEARDLVVRKQLSVRQTEELVKRLKTSAPVAVRRKTANPELTEQAVRLQRRLGTQVRIVPKARGGKGGKIEIAYYSAEELERLLEWFTAQR